MPTEDTEAMETYSTTKGQIVIPAALRRKYGIRAGTKILVYDDGERIILKPVTAEYVKSLQGCLKGKGALKELLEERARDRERE
jgi:AbrB family looped-hinge helix DNA binding protein